MMLVINKSATSVFIFAYNLFILWLVAGIKFKVITNSLANNKSARPYLYI